MTYPAHLDINSKIPGYGKGVKKDSKRKIQEIMREYEYDEDYVEAIDDNFCQGFGVARDIIFEFLREKYYAENKENF